MAGYIWHIIHAYETYMHLSLETKKKMPKDALRSFIMGAIVPDLTCGVDKYQTHFYKDHPIYGSAYHIPDMEKVSKLFMKADPTYLGVFSHLKYDKDHIERFLLVYAKPCGDDEYENTTTGEKLSGKALFGNSNGQLYELYNKFNSEMIKEYMSQFNSVFGTDFSWDKDGFLEFVKWLFPEKMPMSNIPEMDNCRATDDIHGILKHFFSNDGTGCQLNANIDDLRKIVCESAVELAEQIDELYRNTWVHKAASVISFYRICHELKDAIRTGWKSWNVKRDRLESVAEHVYAVQMLAIAMHSEFEYKDIDIIKVIYMLAIHELGETIIGDLTQFQISKEEKEKIEHEAVHKILEGLLNGKQIEELFLEFDAHETKEAMFAYQCDKLECDLQCKLYDQEGCVDLTAQEDNPIIKNNTVNELLQSGYSWSKMWLTYDQKTYPYDENFTLVSNYAMENDI